MEIISSIKNISNSPRTVVTMGTFDGVHIGHQAIIRRLKERAAEEDAKSMIITYVPHPREIIHDMSRNPIQFLTTLQERIKLIAEQKPDYLIVHPFNKDLLRVDAERYIENYLLKYMKVQGFVVGYSHSFGRDRQGTPEFLKKLGDEKYGYFTEIVPRISNGEFIINSTNIRRLIATGDIDTANRYLGRPFHIRGTVVSGDNRGSKIGFPTVNILPLSPKKILPHIGVYCVSVLFRRKLYRGMCNIGYRPTFDGKFLTIEIHIPDHIVRARPGNEIEFRILHRIRDEKRFDSVDALIAQLEKDKLKCKEKVELEDS